MGSVQSKSGDTRSNRSIFSHRTSSLKSKDLQKATDADGEEDLLLSEDDYQPSCPVDDKDDVQTSFAGSSPNSPELAGNGGKGKRGTIKRQGPDTKLEDVIIVSLTPDKCVELQKKVYQLAKCARNRKHEVKALFDAVCGSFEKWDDRHRRRQFEWHLDDWDTISDELKRAKLKTSCGIKTLRRFDDVHAQCIQAFRDFDTWIQESYDLIETEGANAPTEASAKRLRAKVGRGGEALHNRFLALRGKLELISKDLFGNWRES